MAQRGGQEAELGSPRAAAVALLLALAPCAASAADASNGAFERTFDLGGHAFDLRLEHGAGRVRTPLPYQGELSVSLPYTVGTRALVGNTQLAASYSFWREVEALPDLDLVARVDLPTAPGARTLLPGLRAVAAKQLGGPIERIHLESELWTSGPELALSYRTALGTAVRLDRSTRASLDLVATRPSPSTGLRDEHFVQLSLSRLFAGSASAQLGLATGFAPTPSFRISLGFDRSF